MYKIKVALKNGIFRDSTNKKVRDFKSDDYDLSYAYCSGLNDADPLFWRDRYFVLEEKEEA